MNVFSFLKVAVSPVFRNKAEERALCFEDSILYVFTLALIT